MTLQIFIDLVTREFRISILIPAVFLGPLLLYFDGNLFWSILYRVHYLKGIVFSG